MEHTLNYNSLLIISIIAFFTPFLVSKLKSVKIPYQVGEIIIGVIVGKTFLNIITPDMTILLLSNLGLAYLMFLSGLEIDVNALLSKKTDKSHITTSIKMFIISAIIAFVLSIFLLPYLGISNGFVLFALIFTASSPGLIVPMFKQKGILKSSFGQIILSFSIICEFVSIIGLTIIFSISENGFSIKSFEFILVFVCAIILYYLAKFFIEKHDFKTPSMKNIHVIIRAAFALILILVVVAEKLDTEIVLGSFLAGLIFSMLIGKAKEEVSHQLDMIGYGFLIPIFFIMVGANVDLRIILSKPIILLKVLVLLVIFLLVKLIPSLLLKKKFGLKTSLSAGMILSAQLSLVIVAAQAALEFGYIGNADYSAFILATILSCVIFPILFEKLLPKTLVTDKVKNKDLVIREVVLSNPDYENKPLKDCIFSNSCRIFSVTRDDDEFLPNATTQLISGDLLVLVGTVDCVDKSIDILSGTTDN
ncbi:cation:proton antiporter [uncultured Clostridium sp.]|jgi:Kef-type K+ transport system membrane component KefB|uniref:cation:proton antiporter n=1 Tax=uncultured Clostridium sp. TaxID=59620 RepID=UPI002614D2B8|nr:cation:proton antiporter [uncultured Clostridium sp.]